MVEALHLPYIFELIVNWINRIHLPHLMHYAWKLDRGKSLLARWNEILKNYSTWHNFRDIFYYLLNMFASFFFNVLHIQLYMLSYVYFIDGEVLEKYRSRLRELLVGVSQRLEMAVESRTYKYLNRCHH